MIDKPNIKTPEDVVTFVESILREMEILTELSIELQEKHLGLVTTHAARMVELNHLRNIVWGEENEEY
jgi:hypothetical protein